MAFTEPVLTKRIPLDADKRKIYWYDDYVASGGYTFGPARIELDDRLRSLNGSTYNSASGRFDLVSPIGTVSAFAQHDGFRQVTSVDGGLRAQPLPFLAVSGSEQPASTSAAHRQRDFGDITQTEEFGNDTAESQP